MRARRPFRIGSRSGPGFTLIEAVGSMAIVSTLFLGVAGMILNYTHVQRVNAAHSSVNRLAQILRDRLRYDSECSQAVSGSFNPVLSSETALNRGTPISLNYSNIGLGVLQARTELPEFNVRIERLNIIGATLQGSFPTASPPRNVYKVSVVLTPAALSVSGLNTSLSPRIVSSVMIGVNALNNNIIGCENSLFGAIKSCADIGKIYAPLGVTTWGSFAPDLGGCIPPEALKGPPGDIVPGPAGPAGATGPAGANGADGGSVTLPGPGPGPVVLPQPTPDPPPPQPPIIIVPLPRPPKSDVRVKVDIADLGARFAPANDALAEERQTLTMKLIRTLQEQQKQIRALAREICLDDASSDEEVRKCENSASSKR